MADRLRLMLIALAALLAGAALLLRGSKPSTPKAKDGRGSAHGEIANGAQSGALATTDANGKVQEASGATPLPGEAPASGSNGATGHGSDATESGGFAPPVTEIAHGPTAGSDEAKTVRPTKPEKPVDRAADAKALYDRAHDAMDESNFARALELAEQSLKLRRTARTYLLRAQAQQRLDRVDDALASVDAVRVISPDMSAVWETRGRILWAARRRDEARAAFERFLEMDPNSPRAAQIRHLINEPR